MSIQPLHDFCRELEWRLKDKGAPYVSGYMLSARHFCVEKWPEKIQKRVLEILSEARLKPSETRSLKTTVPKIMRELKVLALSEESDYIEPLASIILEYIE